LAFENITKKKILKEIIPQAIPSSISTPVTLDVPISNIDAIESNNLVVQYTQEASAWKSLIDTANTELFSTSIPAPPDVSSSSASIDTSTLQDWFNTGNTIWPDAIIAYEKHQWNNGTSILGIMYGTLQEVWGELTASLVSLGNQVNTDSMLTIPKEVRDAHQVQISSASNFRELVQQAITSSKKEITTCFIRNLVDVIRSNSSKTNLSSNINISNSKGPGVADAIGTLKAISAITSYSLLDVTVNWTATRKNILNHLVESFAMQELFTNLNLLGSLNAQVTKSSSNFLQNSVAFFEAKNCPMFNDFLITLSNDTIALRNKYVYSLYDIEKVIADKYSSRGTLLELAKVNVQKNTHVATLNLAVEALTSYMSTGVSDPDIVKYLLNSIKNTKSK
jgi:hypothetical protein